MKLMAVLLKGSISCASKTSQIKPMSFPPMPVSTMACVRKGKSS